MRYAGCPRFTVLVLSGSLLVASVVRAQEGKAERRDDATTDVGQAQSADSGSAPGDRKDQRSGAATKSPSAGDGPTVPTPAQPSVEDILEEFNKQRPVNEPVLPVDSALPEALTGRPGDVPGGMFLLPDGSFLVDRVGRLIKEGVWHTFVFETDNPAHPEPPMRLLPNQMLERMVRETRRQGPAQLFVVSGEVSEFENRNYLLLRKLLRRRPSGNLTK